MREEILRELKELAESDYKEFNSSLIPGVDKDKTLGVRVPLVRKTAKKAARKDWEKLLSELENCLQEAGGVGGTALYYEEVMLQGMVIGAAKMGAERRLSYIERFIPRIDNWAICDTFCGDLKFADKEENRQLVWNFLQPYLSDEREFFVRFGTVMLLSHFVDEEHIDSVLRLMEGVRHEGYYAKMAVAWTLSVCYVKFPEKTEKILRNGSLDNFTQNKTIQKIRESYRVSKEDKQRLNLLKRK